MKYVIDTCGWVEKITAGKLSAKFTKYFKSLDDVLVPTLVQYELFKWVCREKDEEAAWNVISVTESCIVKPLDTSTALLAADMSKQFKLAMADAVIYAYSRKHNLELVTSDAHFSKLSNVTYFKK